MSTKFTHADFLLMSNDNKRREIADGELLVTPSPNLSHQRASRNLQFALQKYLEKHPIGELLPAPMDVILSDYDVLEPDLLFVLNEHRGILKDWVRGAPDLVIEILSPATTANDRGPKMKAYARFGVPNYWIVDPDRRSIETFQLVQEGYELTQVFFEKDSFACTLLPRFELRVGDIFRP